MVMLMVAAAESSPPSLALKVNESAPDAPAVGVNVRFGPVPDSDPLVGWVSTAKVSGLDSTSAPVNVTATGTFAAVFTEAALAMGASLIGRTVNDTVAGVELVEPSFARNVNESAPLKLVPGRYVRFGGVPVS